MPTEDIYPSTRQVAEGAKSCTSLHDLALRSGVDAPIAEAVVAVVAGKMTAPETMEMFISRDTKAETD
jgi:glycerol-3-phosphate dehydrogenase (NAD(P)+)